jgi:hypothetical protein
MATFWANPFTGIAIRLNPAFFKPAVGWNANTKHEMREYIPCMQRTRTDEGQYCHASMVNPESGMSLALVQHSRGMTRQVHRPSDRLMSILPAVGRCQ